MFVGGDGGIIHTTCWMWYILVEAQIEGVSGDVKLLGVMEFLGGVPWVCAAASACLPAFSQLAAFRLCPCCVVVHKIL